MPPSSPLQSAGAPTTVGTRSVSGTCRRRRPGPVSGRSRPARRARTPATLASRRSSLRGTRHDERVHDGAQARRHAAGPGAARRSRALGGALLARERREREARADALRGRRARGRRAAASAARARETGGAPQLHDDLGACAKPRTRAQRRRPATHRARRTGHALAASRDQRTPNSHFASHSNRVNRYNTWRRRRCPGGKSRVVEIVGRVVRHADPPHDRLRAHVLRAS